MSIFMYCIHLNTVFSTLLSVVVQRDCGENNLSTSALRPTQVSQTVSAAVGVKQILTCNQDYTGSSASVCICVCVCVMSELLRNDDSSRKGLSSVSGSTPRSNTRSSRRPHTQTKRRHRSAGRWRCSHPFSFMPRSRRILASIPFYHVRNSQPECAFPRPPPRPAPLWVFIDRLTLWLIQLRAPCTLKGWVPTTYFS